MLLSLIPRAHPPPSSPAAKMECGECVGGKTGKTAKRDCAGKCGEENELRRVGQKQMCIPKGQADPLPCDNKMGSNAFINA